jgi:RNA polymerase sigma-70 factor, ECF subfamily
MAFFKQNDNSGILKKLYFEHYASLCQIVYRFVNNKDAAKDIVQDVFIKYWKRLGKIHIHESEAAYLRKACIYGALNYLKETERRKQRESRFGQESDMQSGERPDYQYSAGETLHRLETVVNQLPGACRQAFLLSRHEGKSYKEIGELLNISVNTVEKHIGKALKALRKAIENTHGD